VGNLFKKRPPLKKRALTPNCMNKKEYRRQIVKKKFDSLNSFDGLSKGLIILAIICIILFLFLPFNL
jgi:hypothetical protein